LHFPHDVAAVHLHRDLADIQLGGDLLIQESSGNEADDLLLAGRQRRKLAPQDGDMFLLLTPSSMPFDRQANGIKQLLVPKGLIPNP